jgi:hypothetical protein
MAIDKLIISNKTALQKKYKTDFPKIESLLKKIVSADKSKGLSTKYIFIDDVASMKSGKARVVTKTSNEKENKNAIDDLFLFFKPDYLLIFGAGDIIPFQKLANDSDDESFVESDLPYACETAYNKNKRIQNYKSPSRVAGRLPDLFQTPDVAYFTQVTDHAINWKPLETFPKNIFALSTGTWNKITDRIISEALKINHISFVSPPNKEKSWKKSHLSPLLHLINCHGADTDHRFWGQHGKTKEIHPASINSGDVHKKMNKGTVKIAECCFGGQLYKPQPKIDLPMSIANSYLLNGAIGFVGSSCTAYGAVNGDKTISNADLIAKYFLRCLSAGASIGRAFLETRQEYFSKNKQPDPIDYKTLAQFNLLGDPSLHFYIPKGTKTPKGKSAKAGEPAYFTATRKERRIELELTAEELSATVCSLKQVKPGINKLLKNEIASVLKKNHIIPSATRKSFAVELPKTIYQQKKNSKSIDIRYHLYSSSKLFKPGSTIVNKRRVLILREVNGKIVEEKMVESK